MKILQPLLTTTLLAIWMELSIAIASATYVGFRALSGPDDFDNLVSKLGSFTLHISKNTSMDIVWAQILFTLPVFMLMAAPAVWLLQRKK